MSGTVALEKVTPSESLTEVISVRLSADEVRRLNRLALIEGRNVSSLIRTAIELLVEERMGPA